MKGKALLPFLGIVIFIALFIISEYILTYFNIFPYRELLSIIEAGDFKQFVELAEKTISIYIFFIIPMISFITALLIGLIARREYHLMAAAISVAPFYITLCLIFLVVKSFYIYSLYALFMFGIPVFVGVTLAKYLKR